MERRVVASAGALDSTFGRTLPLNADSAQVLLQPDAKILVAGTALVGNIRSLFVQRLNAVLWPRTSHPPCRNGGGGHDSLYGDAGNDRLLARDNVRDTLYGGSGIDSAAVDSATIKDLWSEIETLLA